MVLRKRRDNTERIRGRLGDRVDHRPYAARDGRRVPQPPPVALPPLLASGLCTVGDVDPDLFFDARHTDEAAEVCARCPVVTECGAWATSVGARGTWGGRFRGQNTEP